MATLDLANLVSYSAQGLLLAAVATAAHAALRLHAPAVSYVYWRAVLAACLFAPLLLMRQEAAVLLPVAGGVSAGVGAASAGTGTVAAMPAASVDWAAFVSVVIAAGIALRLLWLARSFARLRVLRRAGRPAGAGETHDSLQRTLGTRAEIRLVPDLAMPVTFGIRRPVILLPASIAERSEDVRTAIVAHELLHVQRRDWLWQLVEEAVCAALWFNPATWWIVSRIQLSREAAVDELAVMATGRRRSYLEALISFADDGAAVPVPAFARRRHLFLRIQSLSREAVMSSTRVVLSSSVLALVVTAGTVGAASLFPMTAAPEPVVQGATAQSQIPKRVDYEAPDYPAVARAVGASGTVTMRVTLDELGRVSEVTRTGFSFDVQGHNGSFMGTSDANIDAFLQKRMTAEQAKTVRDVVNAFTESAERALRQWRFEPPSGTPPSFEVRLSFKPDGETGATQVTPRVRGTVQLQAPLQSASGLAPVRVGGNIKTPLKIRDVRPVYPAEAKEARVQGLVIVEALIGADGTVEQARVLRSIPLLDQAALDAVAQWRFTPTLLNGQAVPVIMTVTVNFTLQDGAAARRPNLPAVIFDVKPQYTPEAMRAGVEGTVETEVTIGTDGSVTDARVVRSLPMLDEQALAAVRQWRFRPVEQPVTTTIELTFSLKR